VAAIDALQRVNDVLADCRYAIRVVEGDADAFATVLLETED
jgi:hypothetical protein